VKRRRGKDDTQVTHGATGSFRSWVGRGEFQEETQLSKNTHPANGEPQVPTWTMALETYCGSWRAVGWPA
jgi:hypothetical protein